MTRAATTTEGRALALLGAGVSPEQVASAIGVTVSRISQLLSDSEFAAEVAELRYQSLAKHNALDNKYDTLEDTLVDKIGTLIPYMMRPGEVLKAIQVINAAKRRGQSTPEQITNQQTVVTITMPTLIVNKFITNVNNQVIQAGNQELLTIQSGSLLKEAQALALTRGLQHGTNGQNTLPAIEGEASTSAAPTSGANFPARAQQEESSFNPAGCFIPA